MLTVKDLSVVINGKSILDHVSFCVEPGEWLMLIGPNGAGKSTLLSTISQGIKYGGSIHFEKQDIARMKPRQRALSFAVLSQRHEVGYAFTAQEVIRLGRYASTGFLKSESSDDAYLIDQAVELTGIGDILKQNVLTLSGGELQRVFLAQIFAQNPKLLLLDEPANHLDLKYQEQIFELISRWVKQPERAVISVVHDLSLAKRYGHSAVLLNHGRMINQGPSSIALSPDSLQEVYGMDVYAWMHKLLKVWNLPQ